MTTTGITVSSLRDELSKSYYPNLRNFLGSDTEAKKFLSAVMYVAQNNPSILTCTKESIMEAFMKCAELGLYPSSVSGEAYIIPYGYKAQFQLGYQGIITLLYRAGITKIYASIVREKDFFTYENGKVSHRVNILLSAEARGPAVGGYAIAIFRGEEVSIAMNKDDILAFKRFSKSANGAKPKESPWNEEKDPELWMWKKTILKQLAKLLPKTADVFIALDEDNKDSVISKDKTTGGQNELNKAQEALEAVIIPPKKKEKDEGK